MNWRDAGATALTTYLPATLMALLAAGTWWLVRQTPMPESHSAPAAARHVVDHEMQRFSAHRFDADGTQRAVVEGRRLRHYLDDGTSLIDAPRLRALDAAGRRLTARAEQGWLSSDQNEVRLTGAAQVVREAWTPPDRPARPSDGMLTLSGEALQVFPREQRVKSDRPVVLVSPGTRVQAGTLDHDGANGITLLGGRVRGQYDAPAP